MSAMFSSGDFLSFPVDDAASIGTASDLFTTSFSASYVSNESGRRIKPRDQTDFPVCTHAHNFQCLNEIPEDRPMEGYHVTNTRDLGESLHSILAQLALCDVIFLVGPALLPIYGLRNVMATRSVILHSLFEKHAILASQAPPKHKKKPGCFRRLFRLKKRSKNDNSSNKQLVISLPEHDPVTFGAFVTYIHTSTIDLSVHNLAGLLHLADTYRVTDLRTACWEFSERCMTSQTVIPLLTSAHRHAHSSESVARLVDVLLQYIDAHAAAVVTTTPFLSTTPHIASTILSRPQLSLSPNHRVAAILSWTKRHHHGNTTDLPATLSRLLDNVDMTRVTAKTLNDVTMLGYVPPMDAVHAPPQQSRRHGDIDTLGVNSRRATNAKRALASTNRRLRKQQQIRAVQSKPLRQYSSTESESGFGSFWHVR